MPERRWGKRFCTEIQARFGEKELVHRGLVQDISVFGFFIVTSHSYPIGTPLRVEVITRDNKISEMTGKVQWNKERPHTSVWMARDGGLGIQIKEYISGREHYENLCQELCRKSAVENMNALPSRSEPQGGKKFQLIRKIFPFKKSER